MSKPLSTNIYFQSKDVSNIREDTYELCYNSACALAGKKCYVDAEKKLRQSEKIFIESLDEDASADEQDELMLIKVQLAYCLQMQGKIKEAATIYTEALKHKTSDAALTAVCSNNSVVINKDQNVFDSKKKIRAAMTEACEHTLNSRQKKAIAINNSLLTLYTNHADQSQQAIAKLTEMYPDIEFDAILIRASQLAKDKKYKEAIEIIENFSKTHPNEELASKFAIVQLLLLNVNFVFF